MTILKPPPNDDFREEHLGLDPGLSHSGGVFYFWSILMVITANACIRAHS